MPYPLPVRVSPFLLLGAALLLPGCCANNVCNCDDAQADAIKLRFSTSQAGPTGRVFTADDLDTLVLLRSPLPYDVRNRPETVVLYRSAAQAQDSIVLNHSTPFAQAGSTRLNGYRYEVQYLAHPLQAGTGVPVRKGVPTTALVIDKILLKGALQGSGCCTCYTNTEKALYRDGSPTLVPLKPDNRVLITKQ